MPNLSLVSQIITVGVGTDDAGKQLDERINGVIFINYTPFINFDCTSEIYNTQKDYAKDMDVVMQMYNLIEYSDNNWANLWQYYRYELVAAIGNSEWFKSKIRITGITPIGCNTKMIEIAVP